MDNITALVLSGGGAKGAYEVGVIKALTEKNIIPDIICGSSIGAVNAALFALGIKQQMGLEPLLAIWIKAPSLFKFNRWSLLSLALPGIPTKSLFSISRVREVLKEYLGDLTIGDICYPRLLITASNLQTGRGVLLDPKTPLVDACLASMAYPVIFPPWQIDDCQYIDGGLFSNTPLKYPIRVGASRIYVVQLTSRDYLQRIVSQDRFQGILEVGKHCIDLLWGRTNYEDIQQAERINQVLDILSLLDQLPQGKYPQLQQIKNKLLVLGKIQKEGFIKRKVEIIKIQPKLELDPPGTFGMNPDDHQRLIEMGYYNSLEIIPRTITNNQVLTHQRR